MGEKVVFFVLRGVSERGMTDAQREAAELLAHGHSQRSVAERVGTTQTSIARWLAKPEFSSYVARLSQEVMDAALRAAAHNIAEGVGELCKVRRKLAKGMFLDDEDLPITDIAVVKEHRETVKALNDLSLTVQKNARESESHALTMATARHEARAAGVPVPGDEQEGTGK